MFAAKDNYSKYTFLFPEFVIIYFRELSLNIIVLCIEVLRLVYISDKAF